jgi:hypothetical protein
MLGFRVSPTSWQPYYLNHFVPWAVILTMGLKGQLPALAAAVSALTVGTAEGLYVGGGLTILSRNDLDGTCPRRSRDTVTGQPAETSNCQQAPQMMGPLPSSSANRVPLTLPISRANFSVKRCGAQRRPTLKRHWPTLWPTRSTRASQQRTSSTGFPRPSPAISRAGQSTPAARHIRSTAAKSCRRSARRARLSPVAAPTTARPRGRSSSTWATGC